MPPSHPISSTGVGGLGLRASDDDHDHGSDSESSAEEIVWAEASAGLVDLRHLLVDSNEGGDNGTDGNGGRRVPLAMTQQIEELSFASVDSSDDEEGEGENGVGMATNDTSSDGQKVATAATAANAAANSAESKAGNIDKAGHETTRTPPPPSLATTKAAKHKKRGPLMHSGEVPATISKLKRRRRGGSGTKPKPPSAKLSSVEESNDESIGCENVINGRRATATPHTATKEGGAGRARPFSQSQAEDIDRELHKPTEGGGNGKSPVGQRKLSFHAAHAANEEGRQQRGPGLHRSHTHPPHHHHQHQQQRPPPRRERHRIRLPPLNPLRRGALEKENEGNALSKMGDGGGKEQKGGYEGGGDLFREIERGLDAACQHAAAGKAEDGDAPPAAKDAAAKREAGAGHATVDGAKVGPGAGPPLPPAVGGRMDTLTTCHRSTSAVSEEIGSSSAVTQQRMPSPPMALRPDAVASSLSATYAPKPTAPAVAHQQIDHIQPTPAVQSADNEYDFDDDTWDDDELAAIDLSAAMTQSTHGAARASLDTSSSRQVQKPPDGKMRHSAPLPPTRSASLPVAPAISNPVQRSASLPVVPAKTADNSATVCNNDIQSYEFDNDDDEWNDDDLAAIDLSVAMTQSHTAAQPMAAASNGIHSAPLPNVKAEERPNGRSEFSDDDDFAEVDFSALDSKIVQHRRLMTQQQRGGGRQPHAPPPNAPIHNRQHDACAALQQQQQQEQPMFLSFTRYIVRSVQEDLNTYTKTVGVSLWRPEGNEKRARGGKNDELDRLRKLCGKNNDNDNNCNSPSSPIDGYLHLRGEWYHTDCHANDIVHLCSLSGQYATDPEALPATLHSHPPMGSDMDDDLVLVVHPDELISPTLVSEAVKCPRLAVLQSRLGSTGLSAKSAVIGTLRHDLFERCLRERDASRRSGALFAREILRDNAESLMGCGIVDPREAFGEVVKILPQVQRFLQMYTSWDVTKPKPQQRPSSSGGSSHAPTALLEGMFATCDTKLSIGGIYSTEEWAHVPELGLKGSVDATVMSRTKPAKDTQGAMQDALMPVELKTGHSQNPSHNHLAQLSTYTVMLRARHGSARSGGVDHRYSSSLEGSDAMGSASSGMLLYLNHQNFVAKHVKPSLSDIKTLIGQRNGVVCDVLRAEQPRGIAIGYEEDKGRISAVGDGQGKVIVNKPPHSALPSLQQNVGSCERCYKNRECMMYASVDNALSNNASSTSNRHGRLLQHFTGHLKGADLDYFRKWDRLIDLEKHASARDVASKSWLFESVEKEAMDGKCISSLVVDEAALPLGAEDKSTARDLDKDATVRFVRSEHSQHGTPLTNLSFEVGSYVIVSEDGTSFVRRAPQKSVRGAVVRHRMHILRGSVASIGENSIDISVLKKDVGRLMRRHEGSDDQAIKVVKFRLDKDEYAGSCGLLLQNLVNFFTLDIPSFSAESLGTPAKTKSLTANTEYSARRRRLNSSIIALNPPPRFVNISANSLFTSNTFALDIPGCDKGSLKRDFDRLNSDQKSAVLKVLSAEDFTLIQGLPGTGKSATIAFVTRLLVSKGKRVLLTSYTHSAVDNLLCKLMESGVTEPPDSQESALSPMVRIGRESACSPKVKSLLAQNIACDAERRDSTDASAVIDKPSVDYLHKIVSAAKVVGVSALTAPRSPLLAGQHFDVVIVDEAGQISQPAILGAIMAADSFVLVGDHMQLPPLVVSEVAEQAGYGISMLMHLAEGFPDAVAKLTMQYRMNEAICHLSNMIAYKGLLKCGNDTVRQQKLDINCSKNLGMIDNADRPWIERAINPEQPVIFLDTDGKGMLESDGTRTGAGGPINEFEASIVENIVLSLSICGVKNSSIGVITPFRSQLRMLNENLALRESKRDGLEMCTIDRFQGRDKSAIIISLVRSNKEGKAGLLLQDFRRLNVAFSRAKKKMIIIGSFSTLHKGSHVMRPVLDSLRQRNWVHTLPTP